MYYDLTSSSWDETEYQALQDVISSDQFTMGEKVRTFEAEFSEKFGTRYAAMVSSGSMANLVSVAALFYRHDKPLRPGDEVIVPTISWATTYYPLHQYGLKLRFVDVDLETLNMDVSVLEEAITSRTRMIVAVNVLGNPANLKEIRKICDQYDLILFEDNCESMGSEVDGKKCGTFGDINTFSLFFSHHIAAMEGGLILTDNIELYHLVLSLRAHGWVRDLPMETKLCDRTADSFSEAYRFILPGYNARPLEMSGAIASAQLQKLDAGINMRRQNAAFFKELFNQDSRFILQKENGKSSWFSFTMIINPELGIKRSDILDILRKADIGFRMITGGNILRHDVIKYFDHSVVGEIVNANIAHDFGFFVGNHPHDLRPQIDRLQTVLSKIG